MQNTSSAKKHDKENCQKNTNKKVLFYFPNIYEKHNVSILLLHLDY